MGVGIYYFYHRFGLEAFEGHHIRINIKALGIDVQILIWFLAILACLQQISVGDFNSLLWSTMQDATIPLEGSHFPVRNKSYLSF